LMGFERRGDPAILSEEDYVLGEERKRDAF
jgi:hypothetical protein